jgi:pimeloyl-ACP methyl ester carboxylesterase
MCGLLLVSCFQDLFEWITKKESPEIIRHFSYSVPSERLPLKSTEKASTDVTYYINYWGYHSEEHRIITGDGHVIVAHRLMKQRGNIGGKGPVLVVHGMFQSSGVFVTNEKESLAFQLVEEGYDVWLGNNRCVYEQHIKYNSKDSEYWDWGIEDLAIHDFPSMLNYVLMKSQTNQLVYIGHSQGNAQCWIALSKNPELSSKLKLFISLAPPVFVGDLLTTKPMSYLMDISDNVYSFIFGKTGFIDIMHPMQKILPAFMFTSLAYRMFHFLFGWSDRNWEISRKEKYYMFTPRPVGTKLVDSWRKIAVRTTLVEELNLGKINCPIALIYGSHDRIIDGDKLVSELKAASNNLIYHEKIDNYEHMDVLWAKDASIKVVSKIINLLQNL